MKSKNDSLKLIFLFVVVLFLFSIFFLTTSIRPASLLTILNILLLAPVIHFLERKKISKIASILIVFAATGVVLALGIYYASTVLSGQWATLSDALPIYGDELIQKLGKLQEWIYDHYSVEINFGATNWIKRLGSNTQDWLITRLPSLIGDLASAFFLVPIFSFFILRDGKIMESTLLSLVPNAYQDTTVKVVTKTGKALSEFLRAKVIEALLVGLLSFIGLMIIKAPYAGVFALIVGITNIVPYLGPVVGAAIPLAIVGFSDSFSGHFVPMLIILSVVNAIDILIIFPIFVAKLVNLNPLILLTAVAVGQEFYGLVGMLISVPLASILKIIFQELVHAMND